MTRAASQTRTWSNGEQHSFSVSRLRSSDSVRRHCVELRHSLPNELIMFSHVPLARFGFLFYGYDERTSWWEALVMIRKLAAIGTTVFLIGGEEHTVSLQLIVLTGIFVGAMLLQARAAFTCEYLGLGGDQHCRLCHNAPLTGPLSFPPQTIFRPHSSRILFRLEILGLLGCTGAPCAFRASVCFDIHSGADTLAPGAGITPDKRKNEFVPRSPVHLFLPSSRAVMVYFASYFFNTIGALRAWSRR